MTEDDPVSFWPLPDDPLGTVAIASSVFDRILADVKVSEGGQYAGTGPRQGRRDIPSVIRDATFDTRFACLIEQVAQLMGEAFSQAIAAIPKFVAVRDDGGQSPAVEVSGVPGSRAIGVVWVHNTAALPVPEFRITVTDLTASGGAQLPSESCTLIPNNFAGSTEVRRSAQLEIDIPVGLAVGTYHGHVFAVGLAAAAVPVCLEVHS